jgi:hypothetical protein
MRREGVQNNKRRDTSDLVAIQVKVPEQLKADFVACIYPRPMVAVIEEMIAGYVAANKKGSNDGNA